MTPDILVEHLEALDAPQYTYRQLLNYYDGRSPLAFLSAQQKTALKNFDRVSANVCRATILALGERLRISGLGDAFDLFLANNLDQRSADVHRSALLYGPGYVLCWTDAKGKPTATVETPETFTVLRDPVNREIASACKRVRTKDTTEAWLYLPDEVRHYRATSPGATTGGFTLIGSVENPLGTPPVAVIGHEDEPSAIADLTAGLQDALNKVLLDGLTASESSAFPRRAVSGIAAIEKPIVDEDGNPVLIGGEPATELINPLTDNAQKVWLSDDSATRFTQLDSADLAAFEALIRVVLSQCMMASGLPAHYLAPMTSASQPTSADSLRASEAALVARVERYQLLYGTGWERVGRLMLAIRDGADPDGFEVRASWGPADTRSHAQEADAAVKLYQAGLLSRRATLRRLGFSDDAISDELAAVDQDASNARDISLGRYMSGLKDND